VPLTDLGLYDKVIVMTDEQGNEAGELLGEVGSLRKRVRADRHGFWFPLVLFGAVTMLSAPLYWQYPRALAAAHCQPLANGTQGCTVTGTLLSGGALNPGFWTNDLGRWVTIYWVAALVLGYVATVLFYRRRARTVGVRQRVWPAVVVGVVILGFALWMNDVWHPSGPVFLVSGDLWMRGTVSVIILSLGLLVLALLERSIWYVLYSLGFVGIALMSGLYNVSNLFDRLGIGRPFDGNGQELPNLLLPAAYLLLGGFVCWALQHHVRRIFAFNKAETP
jgi:hypothetical protein